VLQAIRREGNKPPFFMVHGLFGTMPLIGDLARVLEQDRPLYALVGRGFDGEGPPHERVDEMLDSYLAEIRAAHSIGPYIVGGMCSGGMVAMELARALSAAGDRVGSVILVDPPLVPVPNPTYRNVDLKADRRVYETLYANVKEAFLKFANQFSEASVHTKDPVRLHRAIEVGMAMLLLLPRHAWPPFDGPTEFIISAERAEAHFHPQSPWRNVVAQPGRIHVIPGHHDDIYKGRLDEVLRLVQFALDSAFDA
jgi:thioesterase domain-containing protein